jgi:hypothetical protein
MSLSFLSLIDDPLFSCLAIKTRAFFAPGCCCTIRGFYNTGERVYKNPGESICKDVIEKSIF